MTKGTGNVAAAMGALAFFLCSAGAAVAGPIALSVSVKETPGCNSDAALGFTVDRVREIAVSAFEKAGYQVVSDYRKVPNGLEAIIDVNFCQNVGNGEIIGYAAGVGMYGVSNGNSAVSNVKRVAFNYSHSFISFGGDSRNNQEGKMQEALSRNIRSFVAKTF